MYTVVKVNVNTQYGIKLLHSISFYIHFCINHKGMPSINDSIWLNYWFQILFMGYSLNVGTSFSGITGVILCWLMLCLDCKSDRTLPCSSQSPSLEFIWLFYTGTTSFQWFYFVQQSQHTCACVQVSADCCVFCDYFFLVNCFYGRGEICYQTFFLNFFFQSTVFCVVWAWIRRPLRGDPEH